MCMTSLRRSPGTTASLTIVLMTGDGLDRQQSQMEGTDPIMAVVMKISDMRWKCLGMVEGGGRKSLTRPSSYPAPSPSAVTHITVCNSTAHIDGEEGRCQNGGRFNGVFVLEPRLPSPLEQSVCPGWTRNRVYLGLYLVDCKWLSLHLRLVHCTRNAIRAA